MLRQGVDAGGLAGIGATDKGNLGHLQRGQKMQLRRRGQELGGVQPTHGHGRGGLGGGGFGGRRRRRGTWV